MIAAVEAWDSVHVEVDWVVKESIEAQSEIMTMCIEGDREPGGNSRFRYTTNFKQGAFGDVTFDIETREADGVSYAQVPMTREWKRSRPVKWCKSASSC